MEDEQWLVRLLEATRAALERLRDPKFDANADLVADLEDYCARLERRLADVQARRPAGPG